MNPEKRLGPIVLPGLLIGFSVGGLVDSILFRQILGAHAFLSAKGSIQTAAELKGNLVWDGVVSAAMVFFLAFGIVGLFQAAKEKDVPWSGQMLFGSWFLGWGLFVLIEGLVAHHLLRLHHLLEYANPATRETGDYGYLIVGALLAVLGYWAVSSTKSEMENAERDARRAEQRAKEAKGDKKVYLD